MATDNDFSAYIADEQAMLSLGQQLVKPLQQQACQQSLLVFLEGTLGVGKTTLSRGILRGCGYVDAVKSPTFTLVEVYELTPPVYHFDLYRLGDARELEYLGIRDYFTKPCLILMEWPARGAGILPAADITITIDVQDNARQVSITGVTTIMANINQQLQASR